MSKGAIHKEHALKIRYLGGVADNNELPLYDGTTSIHGICQSLQIATHAYLNNEIVSRATAAKGARFYLRPTKRGSFIFEIITIIEKYPATAATAAAVAGPAFYDFIKIAFGKATGLLEARPETSHVQRLMERDEPFFDDLAETLEGSLQRAHRPIGDEVNKISIERPRSPLIKFDAETQNWVNTREEVPTEETITGNVTRYNSVTRNGRIYVDQLHRIVPFKLDGDFSVSWLGLLTWSLHGSNSPSLPKKLEIQARHVKSAHGHTKRLLLAECRQLED